MQNIIVVSPEWIVNACTNQSSLVEQHNQRILSPRDNANEIIEKISTNITQESPETEYNDALPVPSTSPWSLEDLTWMRSNEYEAISCPPNRQSIFSHLIVAMQHIFVSEKTKETAVVEIHIHLKQKTARIYEQLNLIGSSIVSHLNYPWQSGVQRSIQDYAKKVSSYTEMGFIIHLPSPFDPDYLLGSSLARRFQEENVPSSLDPRVGKLLFQLWNVTFQSLREFHIDFNLRGIPTFENEQISLSKLNEAHAFLLQLRHSLETSGEILVCQKLASSYTNCVPWRVDIASIAVSPSAVAYQQGLVSVLCDMLHLNEGLEGDASWETMQYRALNCNVTPLEQDDSEYSAIANVILSDAIPGTSLSQIFSIRRYGDEHFRFSSFVENKGLCSDSTKLLFHGTKALNLFGILSHGFVLPKFAPAVRSDIGFLGAGIYFATTPKQSLRYSDVTSLRFLLLARVFVGKSISTTNKLPSATNCPPPGYHSYRGQPGSSSCFQEEEFCIYDTAQQEISYLVVLEEPSAQPQKQLSLPSVLPPSSKYKYVLTHQNSLFTSIPLPPCEGSPEIIKLASKSKAGLISNGIRFPILSTHIRATVVDILAEVALIQEFKSYSTVPIEAQYVFPLDCNAAVCAFVAYIDDKKIVGTVKEKETARKTYTKAVYEGKGAYLLDQVSDSLEMWQISLGNLPPGAVVTIIITYVVELECIAPEGELLFTIPAAISGDDRVLENDNNMKTGQGVTKSMFKTEKGETPCDILVGISMPRDILSVTCPSHTSEIKWKTTDTMATVFLQTNKLDRDVVIKVTVHKPNEPHLIVESSPDGSSTAAMLAWIPDMDAKSQPQQAKDFYILVDRSSSMKAVLPSLRNALSLLLNILLDDDSIDAVKTFQNSRFSLLGFGSRVYHLFGMPQNCRLNGQPLSMAHSVRKAARSWVSSLQADMGTTDVLQALKWCWASSFANSKQIGSSVVIFLTDGQFPNNSVKASVRFLRGETQFPSSCRPRIFVIGVGKKGVSRSTIHQLARSGEGFAHFLTSDIPSVDDQKQLRHRLYLITRPFLRELCVDWKTEHNCSLQVPAVLPSTLFLGQQQVCFALIDGPCTWATVSSTQYDSDDSNPQTVIKSVSVPESDIRVGNLVHRLTARSVIREWTEENLLADDTDDMVAHTLARQMLKERVVTLGVKYGIASEFTSFVAVEERNQDESEEIGRKTTNAFQLASTYQVDLLPYLSWSTPDCGDFVMEPELFSEDGSPIFTVSLTGKSKSGKSTWISRMMTGEFSAPSFQKNSDLSLLTNRGRVVLRIIEIPDGSPVPSCHANLLFRDSTDTNSSVGTIDTNKLHSTIVVDTKIDISSTRITDTNAYCQISSRSNYNIEKPALFALRLCLKDPEAILVEAPALAPPEVVLDHAQMDEDLRQASLISLPSDDDDLYTTAGPPTLVEISSPPPYILNWKNAEGCIVPLPDDNSDDNFLETSPITIRSPTDVQISSPPRKSSQQEQSTWKIPPWISNWKNAQGYTVPLEERISVDGQNIKVSAERTAREEVARRNFLPGIQKSVPSKEQTRIASSQSSTALSFGGSTFSLERNSVSEPPTFFDRAPASDQSTLLSFGKTTTSEPFFCDSSDLVTDKISTSKPTSFSFGAVTTTECFDRKTYEYPFSGPHQAPKAFSFGATSEHAPGSASTSEQSNSYEPSFGGLRSDPTFSFGVTKPSFGPSYEQLTSRTSCSEPAFSFGASTPELLTDMKCFGRKTYEPPHSDPIPSTPKEFSFGATSECPPTAFSFGSTSTFAQSTPFPFGSTTTSEPSFGGLRSDPVTSAIFPFDATKPSFSGPSDPVTYTSTSVPTAFFSGSASTSTSTSEPSAIESLPAFGGTSHDPSLRKTLEPTKTIFETSPFGKQHIPAVTCGSTTGWIGSVQAERLSDEKNKDDSPAGNLRVFPPPMSHSFEPPRRGTGIGDEVTIRARNSSAFKKERNSGSHVSENKYPITTPFGILAVPAPAQLADRVLTHVLRGPRNNRSSGTCWLDSVLCFLLCFEPLRKLILIEPHVEGALLPSVFPVLWSWLMDKCASTISKRRNTCCCAFDYSGYKKGNDHSVVESFLALLREASTNFPEFTSSIKVTTATQGAKFSSRKCVLSDKRYLVCVNGADPLPPLSQKSYDLLAMIAYQSVPTDGEPAHHFITLAFDKKGYTVYDDLLCLNPGGWQGGFVPYSSPEYSSCLASFTKSVPLFVLQQKQYSI